LLIGNAILRLAGASPEGPQLHGVRVQNYNWTGMHVISRKALHVFWAREPDSEQPLRRWYKLITSRDFATFAELRETFPSADIVDQLTVFNIGGNKYRLIASVHFNRKKVYIRHVLTHAEYDRGDWKP
jgi:mRNA interferase HigB